MYFRSYSIGIINTYKFSLIIKGNSKLAIANKLLFIETFEEVLHRSPLQKHIRTLLYCHLVYAHLSSLSDGPR